MDELKGSKLVEHYNQVEVIKDRLKEEEKEHEEAAENIRFEVESLEVVLNQLKKGICSYCNGKGKIIVHDMDSHFKKCRHCNGTGLKEG